ncbi:MAG TPA: plasmid stabilization protein [Verrucomicrobiales bacterium]|mgnify:CR=1 FL=1|nr:plasmid stabilization protein [Verrucomicrobiales bacterium]
MKRAVFHPEASREYLDAIEYHAAIRVELGERFDSEIQRLVDEISRDPQRFLRIHPPVQRALSPEFPYSVVYLDQPDRVWIVAVMHAKRRPGYWKKRVG